MFSRLLILYGGQEREEPRRGKRHIYLSVPGHNVLEGNLCTSPPCGITFQDTRKIKKPSWPQSGTPQRPNLQIPRPNKDSTRPLPRPLRRPGPASSRCLAWTFHSQRNPNPGPSPPAEARPGPPRSALRLPTHPQDPLAPPGGGGGGGGSRVRENLTKWRRPLEPRRDRALYRAPAHARTSARCLFPPLRGSRPTNPTAACK